jgi:hypothetical protein
MFEAAFVTLSEINRLAQVGLCCNLPRGWGGAPRGWCNGAPRLSLAKATAFRVSGRRSSSHLP